MKLLTPVVSIKHQNIFTVLRVSWSSGTDIPNPPVQVVEKLKLSGPRQPSAPLARAGPQDVPCDFCSGAGPNKAAMSCLTCMASYCPAHLEPHRSVPVLKKHELVCVSVPLQEKMCAKHNKLMVY